VPLLSPPAGAAAKPGRASAAGALAWWPIPAVRPATSSWWILTARAGTRLCARHQPGAPSLQPALSRVLNRSSSLPRPRRRRDGASSRGATALRRHLRCRRPRPRPGGAWRVERPDRAGGIYDDRLLLRRGRRPPRPRALAQQRHPAGTYLLKSIVAGAAGGVRASSATAAGRLFFVADDPAHARSCGPRTARRGHACWCATSFRARRARPAPAREGPGSRLQRRLARPAPLGERRQRGGHEMILQSRCSRGVERHGRFSSWCSRPRRPNQGGRVDHRRHERRTGLAAMTSWAPGTFVRRRLSRSSEGRSMGTRRPLAHGRHTGGHAAARRWMRRERRHVGAGRRSREDGSTVCRKYTGPHGGTTLPSRGRMAPRLAPGRSSSMGRGVWVPSREP